MSRSLARIVLGVAVPLVMASAQQPTARRDALLVLNKGEATASLIALADGATLAKMPVGEAPHEVTVSSDGRTAVAANYGTAQAPGQTLTVLDLVARKPARTIDLGEYRRPHGIAWLPDGRRVLVTSEATQAVVVVDVAAGRVERAIKTNVAGTHLFVLAKDGRRVWTSNIGGGSNSLIDLETGTLVKTAVTGKGPEAIDLSPGGREVWTADSQLGRITILAANTLDSLATIPTGERPNRLHFTPDGRWALVSNMRSNSVTVYDARGRRLVQTIQFPYDSLRAKSTIVGQMGSSTVPEGILIAPDGTRAWVALSAMDVLAEVDVPTWKVVRYLTTGREPDGMGYVIAAVP